MATANNGALIDLSGVERVFHLGDSEVHALHALDLRVAPGEYIAVMGPSGSGKSTLLNIVGLLDRPNAGRYLLEGRDVTTLSAEEQARVRSRRIGFVFQSFHLVPRLTAAENIALPMMLAGIPPREFSCSSSRTTSSPVVWSRLPVGSSARISAGCMIVARAIATRCRCPPESWSGR